MALVLFSGGQDSTTCLAWALERFERVETLGFDYGQRHRIELEQRACAARRDCAPSNRTGRRGSDRTTRSTSARSAPISDTALTGDKKIELTEKGLPNTFVPGRNLIFLTFAAALAYRRGLTHIVGGMCETDFSGYPDCRDDAIKAMQVALNIGMESRFVLETPLMWLDKAQTWALARKAGWRDPCQRPDRAQPHLLSRRTRREARLGLRLRPMSGLRAAGAGLRKVANRRILAQNRQKLS